MYQVFKSSYITNSINKNNKGKINHKKKKYQYNCNI